ncbi:MAG: pilus assembly protein [Nocardiopsaceae bacterium]|nr:pilus assembly protein [Nocardiopsaceae bacterium]
MSRADAQRGSAPVELTILTPVLLLLVMLIMLAGRVTGAQSIADEVAHDAARAASLERTPQQAEAAARSIAESTLQTYDLRCQEATLVLDHGGLSPGGTVTATLTCHVALKDLSGLGVSGSHAVNGESTVVIDTFRGAP